MTAHPADDWQQNADVALMQSQRLERSEQPGTEEQYRLYVCYGLYVMKACLKRGREVTVMPKTCTSKDSSWLGLATYAWSG